jgi:hypothetical protein
MSAWARVFHWYGRATDAEAHLEALWQDTLGPLDQDTSDGFYAKGVPYTYISWALIGERPTPATVLTLRWFAAHSFQPDEDEFAVGTALLMYQKVAEDVLGGEIDAWRALAATRDTPAVANWLAAYLAEPEPRRVAEWTDADQPGQVLLAAAAVDCYDLIPTLYEAVAPLMNDPWQSPNRDIAAIAARALVRHPDLAEQRPSLLAAHQRAAADAEPGRRGALVLGIAKLGGDVQEWLSDPYLGVRVCAALRTPGTVADELLLAVSRSPGAFAIVTMQILGDQTQALIEAACVRVPDFDRLWPGAVAALSLKLAWVGGQERAACAPYLPVGFPHGLPAPADATPAQRAFAKAAIERIELWAPAWPPEEPWEPVRRKDEHGPWVVALAAAGLPIDRLAWQAVAEHRPPVDANYANVRLLPSTFRTAARQRPQMFVGCTRTDPDFATRLVGLVAAEVTAAGGRTEVLEELRFSVDVRVTAAFDWHTTEMFEHLLRPRMTTLEIAAAYTSKVVVRIRDNGVEYLREYLDGLAIGPAIPSGPTDAIGMNADFYLDELWLPRGARILISGPIAEDT